MPNPWFAFKQFTIRQERCAMKVGTDGVLLGAWADAEKAQKVLDIGTGTALIALMIAQRSNAHIIGIEIDEEACQQASENINESPWKDRISIKHIDFESFALQQPGKFDLIVCNPPYFHNSLHPEGKARTQARHSLYLTREVLFLHVAEILAQQGSFAIIVPADEEKKLLELAQKYGLMLQKITYVKPTPENNPKRVLLKFGFSMTKPLQEILVIEEGKRHKYSDKYKSLTQAYYLNF